MRKIPRFKTQEQAVTYWKSHPFQDYTTDIRNDEIVLVKRVKKTVAVRLDPEDVKAIERIAKRKGMNYTALLRMWIKEQLVSEARRGTDGGR
jgi:predicted DNA binding CopG/RHH family protein